MTPRTPTTPRDRERWRHKNAVRNALRRGLPPPPRLPVVPRGKPPRALVERLWSKIDTSAGLLACWEWQGALNQGYAQINVDGKHARFAHRVMYALVRGPIPAGFHIDHLCRNTRCVNPEHLEAVTPQENNRRSESSSARRARQTHCKYGHPFDEANTYYRKTGWRNCRTCRRRDSLRANRASA